MTPLKVNKRHKKGTNRYILKYLEFTDLQISKSSITFAAVTSSQIHKTFIL